MIVLPSLSPLSGDASLNFFSHALLKEFQDTKLRRMQTFCILLYFLLILAQSGKQRSIEIGVDHLWVYITFTADSFGVAKMPGGHLDSLSHVFLGLCLRLELSYLLQRVGSKNSARPSTEVLGGEVLPRNF